MVVAVRVSPPVKGKVPKLNMLELVSVANNRYKISKLRKRFVPEGYCYVCSRIDPSGVFSKPNGYLFKKGFLHTCEHFPKAPYTTFVQEEIPIQDDDGGDSLVDFAIDKTETISVTIRRGSRSTGHTSASKADDSFESSGYDRDKFKKTDFSAGKFRLPSLASDLADGLSARSEPNRFNARKLHRLRKPPDAQTGFRGQSLFKIESIYTGSEPSSVRGHMNNKATESAKISARSFVNENFDASKSVRENELDSMLNHKQSATSLTSGRRFFDAHGIVINQSDGLQNAFTLEPLIREEIMIAEPREPARRLKARFKHDRKLQDKHAPSEHSTSTYRPESAHLRYHHRMTDDSVPEPGFEIPPTPDDIIGTDNNQIVKENSTDNSTADSKDTTGSSVNNHKNSDVVERSSKNNQVTNSVNLNAVSSDNKSFCRCATDLREISFTRNVCRTCGKDCKFRNSLSRGSSLTNSHTGDGSIASKSGRFRSTRLTMPENEIAMYGKNARTTVARNGHNIDRKFAFNEEDDQYWSSDEEFFDFEQSPVSWLRNDNPYPVLNPDIHKDAYLAALQAARMKGKQNLEDFEIDELKMLRRPNVFSYIPLLPLNDKSQMKYIGIRPDNSSKPKKGQFMKHIFGDVQLDDFYPKLRPRKGRKITIEPGNESISQQTTANNNQDPAMPGGTERSISLKMKSRNN